MQKPDTTRGRLWGGGLRGITGQGLRIALGQLPSHVVGPLLLHLQLFMHRLCATICRSYMNRSSFTRRRQNV